VTGGSSNSPWQQRRDLGPPVQHTLSGPLAEEVALVTGAGSGIGAACARRLAADGAAVAVTDLKAERAHAVAETIVRAGGQARAWALDVGDEESIAGCVEDVAAALGPVSILHNNAAATDLSGSGDDSEIVSMSVELWDRTMAVNLRGPMLMCRAVLPAMIRAGGGAIVNTSSGRRALPSTPGRRTERRRPRSRR
jgi:NAD(P)-dependent dehydrogenase (short-subunit alcohol dehydrogenase family)